MQFSLLICVVSFGKTMYLCNVPQFSSKKLKIAVHYLATAPDGKIRIKTNLISTEDFWYEL